MPVWGLRRGAAGWELPESHSGVGQNRPDAHAERGAACVRSSGDQVKDARQGCSRSSLFLPPCPIYNFALRGSNVKAHSPFNPPPLAYHPFKCNSLALSLSSFSLTPLGMIEVASAAAPTVSIPRVYPLALAGNWDNEALTLSLSLSLSCALFSAL